MKSIIIYYSYGGNTEKVANELFEFLKEKGSAEIVKLKELEQTDNFFLQSKRAFRHERANIEDINFDLSGYDIICFGTPVWAFGPAPAMNAYLDKCFGVEKKKIVLFATYGSGVGKNRCLNYIERILIKKNAGEFKKFTLQQAKVNDKEFVISKIKEILPL